MTSTQQEITGDARDGDTNTYRCGICGTEYEHELLTRVHITRSKDEDHKNIDGTMPESEIQVLNEDGEVVETLTEPIESINVQSLTVDDLPDNLTEEHKRIILAAVHNPNETNYSNLEDEAGKLLQRDGYDVPSYSTIRRVIRQFFRPHEEGQPRQKTTEATTQETETGPESLSDLTPKQAAILIAKYANPDETKKSIAERVDSAKSYPGQVEKKASEVDDRLNQQIKDGMPVPEVILAELEPENLEAIEEAAESNNWDLGIDLRSAVDEEGDMFDLGVDEQDKAMSASPFEADEPESEPEPTTTEAPTTTETWGEEETEPATTNAETETVEPTTTEQEEVVEVEETETTSEPVADRDTEPEPETEPATAETTDDSIPRHEVERLLEKVDFARGVTEDGEDGKRTEREVVLQKVEEEIEALLETN